MKDIRQSGWGLLFLLLCCWHTAAGQLSYTFRKYTVDDGLPSANIYDLKQDAKGFLWMATESGICRFDGRMFEKEPLEALGNTEVIKLYFDRLDRLWLADLGNNILLYDQDSLRNLNLLPGFRGESYTNIFEDKSGDFWLSGALDPNVTFLEGQRLSDSTTINYNSPYFNSSKVFISINDTLQHLIGKTGVSAFRNHRMEYKAWPKRFRLKTAPQATTRIRDTILVATLDGLFSYSRIKMQLTPAFRKFREMFGGGITVMLTDRDENLWVGTRDGVILFPANQRDRPQRYLTDRFISGIVQDHEGGYWLATQKDGLFYLPGLNIKTYRNPGLVNQLTAVTTDSMGSTIIGFDNSWVNALDRDYRLRGQWKMSRQDGEIYDIIKDDRENFFFLHNRQIEKRNKLFELMYQLDGSYKSGNFLSENKLYLGTTNVALLLDTEERTRDTLLNFRTYSILPISENEIWVGTIRGLFHFYNNTFTLQENPLLQQDIRDIQIAADSTLWLATQADGLILYKNGEVIQHLTTRSGLVSNNCKKLWLEGPYAWLATNKGLHRFDQSDRSFITITRDHGLPSNEINDFAQHGNTLLCATNNGLAILTTVCKSTPSRPAYSLPASVLKTLRRR
ncbi:MAG: two-component regulator propeller domain-containing protein [Bacteroidota bacterium]